MSGRLRTRWIGISSGYVSSFSTRPYPYLTSMQGENVTKKQPVRLSFYRMYRKDSGRTFTANIIQCDDAIAPTRYTSGVVPLCEIKCTITKPYSTLEDYINKRSERLKKFSSEVDIVPSGAAVEFALYFGGMKQGAQYAKVVFQ